MENALPTYRIKKLNVYCNKSQYKQLAMKVFGKETNTKYRLSVFKYYLNT